MCGYNLQILFCSASKFIPVATATKRNFSLNKTKFGCVSLSQHWISKSIYIPYTLLCMTFATIIITLLLSGFFSGSEIAYLSADRLRIALKKQQGSKAASILVRFFDNPSLFLGTMLVGNNIVLVIFGNLMESALVSPLQSNLPNFLTGDLGILLSITIITTIVVLIFGEFVPKLLFRLFATSVVTTFAYLYNVLQFALSPLVVLMVRTSEWLLTTLLRIDLKPDQAVFTRVDLMNFIRDHSSEEIDTEMFEKAIALNQVLVKHCMIKRHKIVSINANAKIEDLMRAFVRSRFSKIIVYNDDLDSIIGYVHHLQLLKKPNSILSIVMQMPVVDQEMPAIDLMNVLMREKVSIAYVQHQDRTVGIITLEDILEELFGEIEDEHDLSVGW